jgi:MFS transporter, YNFM family, putative membrane transport protein
VVADLSNPGSVQSKPSHLLPRWLALFTLAHFGHHLLTALPTPLLPFIRDEFHLDYARSGLAISVFSITYGLSQLPAGWLADRLGTKVLLTIGILGVAFSGVVIYFFTPSYVLLLAFLLLMGLVGGGYHPAAPPLVCATVPAASRGRALGIHAIGGSASFMVAPLVAAAVASAWGWRSAYLTLAIPTLLLGLVVMLALERSAPPAPTPRLAPEASSKKIGFVPGQMAGFIATSALGNVLVSSAIAFIPLLLVDHFHLSEAAAAALLAVIYFTGIWANPVAGYLADRFGRRRLMLSAAVAVVPALYFFNAIPRVWEVVVLLVAFGTILAALQTSTEAQIISHVPSARYSSFYGLYYFSTMAGGGLLVPALGALIDQQGYSFSFRLLALLMAAAIAAYSLWQVRHPASVYPTTLSD